MKFAIIIFLYEFFLNTIHTTNIIFKNYTFASTYIPSLSNNTTRHRRSKDCITLILNIYDEQYKLCINIQNLSENNGLIYNETTLFVYHEKSNMTININETCIEEAKGYVMDKPFWSSVNGHIEDGKFYGKIQIQSKTFYVEDISKFPSLINKQNHNNKRSMNNNAIIYENNDIVVNSVYNKNITQEVMNTIPEEIKQDFLKTIQTTKALG